MPQGNHKRKPRQLTGFVVMGKISPPSVACINKCMVSVQMYRLDLGMHRIGWEVRAGERTDHAARCTHPFHGTRSGMSSRLALAA
jgi:hypothetical protein